MILARSSLVYQQGFAVLIKYKQRKCPVQPAHDMGLHFLAISDLVIIVINQNKQIFHFFLPDILNTLIT